MFKKRHNINKPDLHSPHQHRTSDGVLKLTFYIFVYDMPSSICMKKVDGTQKLPSELFHQRFLQRFPLLQPVHQSSLENKARLKQQRWQVLRLTLKQELQHSACIKERKQPETSCDKIQIQLPSRKCLDAWRCQAVLLKNTMVLQTGCYFGTLSITRCNISKIRKFHNSSIEMKWKTLLKEAGLGDTHPPQTFTSRNLTQPGIVLSGLQLTASRDAAQWLGHLMSSQMLAGETASAPCS